MPPVFISRLPTPTVSKHPTAPARRLTSCATPRCACRRAPVTQRLAASAYDGAELDSAWPHGDTFYEILGVHPAADQREIRMAYLELMRQHHPDRAAAPGSLGTVDTTEVCALINSIYATLCDPEARALYDAVAGFSPTAVNPFRDGSFPVDQVFVDEVSCIGCGKCVRACPGAFYVEASYYGRARVVPGADVAALADEVDIAMETCPVDCIHRVTSPQLALLETALSGMQRVDAFLMLRQQRATGNVFDEAERAWQKRQAVLAALRRQHEASVQSQGWAGIWSAHVEMRRPGDAGGVGGGDSDDADAAAARDPARRRVADLAASASRAMRRWRAAAALSSPHKALAE